MDGHQIYVPLNARANKTCVHSGAILCSQVALRRSTIVMISSQSMMTLLVQWMCSSCYKQPAFGKKEQTHFVHTNSFI